MNANEHSNKIVIKNGLKIPAWLTIHSDVESKDWLGSGLCQYIVPDFICGISMKKAGYIHDKCFEAQLPFDLCNEMFLYNMRYLIRQDKNLIFRNTAMAISKLYYWAVKYKGRKYYDACRASENTNLS
jgi:hypothetical protein